jgi:hypothetical protein
MHEPLSLAARDRVAAGRDRVARGFPRAVVGFSDHSIGPEMALASVALGAASSSGTIPTRATAGPDISCSMDPAELRFLIDRSREIWIALNNPKARTAPEEDVYRFARASVVADADLPEGHVITEADIWARRPGSGEIAGYDFDQGAGYAARCRLCIGVPRPTGNTLRLTSNKYKVIRRGERGFSRAMIAAGYRVAGLCPNEELPRHLEDVDDAFLREMLEHAAYIDRDLAEDRDRLLSEDGPGWRVAVIDHVRRTLVKRQAYSSFPLAMMRLGYPFLKKSHDEVASAWRSGVFTASQAGLVELPRPLMAELRTYGNCAGAPGATGVFPSRRAP